LLEKPSDPVHGLGDVRVNFAVSALEIRVGDESRSTVSGARYVNDVQIVFPDQPVEMNVDKIQPGSCAPMTEQTRLDMFEFQRFLEQRIRIEINLARANKRAFCVALLEIEVAWIRETLLSR
jgi:hypothetical protein